MEVSITNFLVHDDAIDRGIVQKQLSALWSLKQQRPQLFYGLPHKIDARTSKDATAQRKLKSFRGPDKATIAYLEGERKGWELDPRSFWFPPAINSSPNEAGPEAQFIGFNSELAHLKRGKGVYLPHDIAQAHDPEKIFQRMLDHGSRYNNLGKHFGRGIVMALGSELPESYWAKLLPKTKSKPLFKEFLKNARQHKVTDLTDRYDSLCRTLLQWFLEHLDSLDSCLEGLDEGLDEGASETLDHTNFLSEPSFPAEFFDLDAYEAAGAVHTNIVSG